MSQAAHRLLSSSFLWVIFRILSGNPKKELLRSLWVVGVPTFRRVGGDVIRAGRSLGVLGVRGVEV